MKVNIWIHKNDVKNLGDMDVPISYIKKYYTNATLSRQT